MKFLLTMNLPYTRAHGGANRSNRGLCADLVRCGHRVRVIVPALATPSTITLGQLRADLAADGIIIDSRPGVDIFTLDGVEVYAVTEQSRLRPTFSEQLRDFAPDWALVSSENPAQSLLDAAHKGAPGRVIYLAHTPRLYPFGPESLYPGDATTFASDLSASRFVDWLGTLKTRPVGISPPAQAQAKTDLAALTPQQRAVLVERLKQKALAKADGAQQTARIPNIPRRGSLPLSFAQQRLWFIDKLEPGLTNYNLAVAVGFKEPFHADLLARSLNEIVARHEILRTTFIETGGQPEQIIASDLKFDLRVEKLSEQDALPFDDALRPFDLARGPLLRPRLVKMPDGDHLLVLTMHHIISDGWSINILLRELSALYNAYVHNRPSPLLPLPIQYADYAVWQREYLQGQVLERQITYWKEQLAGAPTLLNLPTDRPRPKVQSGRGAIETFILPEELSAALRQLSRREGVTLFMTLLAAFQVLLHKYSGQDDLVVGSPIAGRNRREVEGLIGFFVNTLALRAKFSGDPSFVRWLKQVREICLGAYAHQELPFERLVEELQPERSLSHHPIFQVMFELENGKPGRTASRESVSWAVDKRATAIFELVLSLKDTGQQLEGMIEYSTDLFNSETVIRMIEHFRLLLTHIVRDPASPISLLPILSSQEEQQLLRAWSGAKPDYPRRQCLHHLFEAQAGRSPDSTAISCEGRNISYGELNHRANQLAHYLQTFGVGPEKLVGICMERSIESVVAMLAALKAGAAYFPLDPSLPVERINYLLEDTRAPVVLTLETFRQTVAHSTVKIISLDSDWGNVSHYPEQNCASRVRAENLAYVMYTSGSTGRPKGVAVTHENVNWLAHNLDQLEIRESDTVIYGSHPSFDAVVYEIWCGLLNGARLEVIGKETVLSAAEFRDQLRGTGASVLYVTAAIFTQLVSHDPTIFSSLRMVVSGGEAIAERWAREVIEQGCPQLLVHEYGPTEATVFSSIQVVEKAQAGERNLPIGKSLSNTKSYVLDEQMRPVPVGVSGELYIGGHGVARGYWGAAEQTACGFVPDPYSEAGGERLYRTGDIVKWRAPGVLEFTGRADGQLKVRGYRIEPGEVEAALGQCPGVSESLVVVRQDEADDKRLVAYVVAKEDAVLSPADLCARLQQSLPDYMIPSAFVILEQFPLTPNGKVDHHALPAPTRYGIAASPTDPDPHDALAREFSLSLRAEAATPPQADDAVQEMLTAIWTALLRVDEIAADDNFFELGGHSLLAMRLLSRIREVFAVELSPRSVFESPTIAGLARQIDAARGQSNTLAVRRISRVSREEPIPLSYAQERLWFLDQLQPGSTAYNIAGAVGLSGALNVEALQASFNELIRRHESLRTRFEAIGGEPVQIISERQEMELEIIDLTELDEAQGRAAARLRAAKEAAAPFKLSEGPLLRASIIRLGNEEHVLLLTMHHIISDGWSLAVLYRELFTVYAAYLRGEASPLPELEVQYADYAVWQREHLQGELLDTQRSYWKEQLKGAPELLDLPTDYARPAMQSDEGASESFSLPATLSDSVRRLSRDEGVTLFMMLLAAFQVLLSKYSEQSDVVIGSPIAGRNRKEVEGLIGFFVNTLALRVDSSGDPTFQEVLRRVREVCLGAYAHQDLPFGKLAEELNPERSLSHNPIFQVMFEFENLPPGARREAASAESEMNWQQRQQTAIFDLVLTMRGTGERLEGVIEYSTDLFSAATIKAMALHFQILLEQLTANPGEQLSHLSLLSPAERHLLLAEWSGADVRRHSDAGSVQSGTPLIHQLFEQQVERTPDGIALSFEGTSISYAELNRSANQLARLLVSRGLGPESLVAIALPRSPDLIVALLASLKAGAAYLPLDPAYPSERLGLMLEDAGASVLLTCSELRGTLPATTAQVICLDEAKQSCCDYSPDNLTAKVTAENLAYVIYTSGSTGTPKGVMISHGALAAYAPLAVGRFGLTASDRFLQFASWSFDVAVEEIFPTLIAGAQLVLCRAIPLGDRFTELLEQERVTVCELPTAYWQEWVRGLAAQQQLVPEGLRLVIVGGEKNTAESVRRWRKVNESGTRLLHVYGVTEATVTTSLYELGSGLVSAESEEVMPLGGVLPNSEVFVLDNRLEPVAEGIYGELYLGGSSLGRGYRGRADATAEKFIPHPFGRRAGERLYRTGDVVRWRAGLLEFAGRADGQVKVRGFRVELGEIETVLKRHLTIRDAAAMVVEKEEGDHRIVAYLVHREHARRLESRKWRHYLKERLPAYMSPSLFIAVDSLPVTANGKIDRQALPQPDWAEVDAERAYVGPNGATQLRLQLIWENIFGIRPISVTDDFFELGGHSLLAVRLISEIHKQFKRDLPLSIIFQGATIEGLASIIYSQQTDAFVSPLVGIQVGGSKRPFFCAHAVGGNLCSYLELARQLGPDQVFYGLETPVAEFGPQFNTLEEMAASYVNEIRSVQPEGPYLIGGWSMGGIIAFEMAHELLRQGQQVGLLAIMDVGPPDEEELAVDEELIRNSLEFTLESFNISPAPFADDWDYIIQQLKADERLPFVLEKAKAAKMLDPALGFEQVRRVYDQININFRLLNDYKPKVYPGKLIFFKGERVNYENEVENLKSAWAALSRQELTMHLLPCSHFEMVHKPHVEQLARLLQGYFEQVERPEQSHVGDRTSCADLVLIGSEA